LADEAAGQRRIASIARRHFVTVLKKVVVPGTLVELARTSEEVSRRVISLAGGAASTTACTGPFRRRAEGASAWK
jgi:hypothetical protein